MAARTIRKGDHFRVEIKCDECGVKAPPAEVIMKGHGLNNIGWECHGGAHLCPAHAHVWQPPKNPPLDSAT